MGRLFTEHLLTVVVFLPAVGGAPAPAVSALAREGGQGLRPPRRDRGLPRCPCRSGPGSTSRRRVSSSASRSTGFPPLGISYSLGIDGISLLLVLLTTILTPVALLFSLTHVEKEIKGYSIAFLLLETGMLGSLVALDLALFYVFWEVMLVPMYFIIGIWGGPRRIYAAMKFFLFTMAGSLLMFLAILFIAIRHQAATGVWSFALEDLYRLSFSGRVETLLFAAFALAFAIKVPVFPLHTWLPDAHTEAPTAGSIILAGVLLKLGRVRLPALRPAPLPRRRHPLRAVARASSESSGVIYGAFVAYPQHDMKRLVAYSSVSHLGLVVMGVGAFTTISLQGSILQMINHGLSTGALFLLVGVLYERTHTREIAAYGGIAAVVPVTTALFLIATLSSIGLPGLERLRRRVPDPRRNLVVAPPLVGGRRGDGRDPLGDLHALARAARLLEPASRTRRTARSRTSGRASSSRPRSSSSSWSGSGSGRTTSSTASAPPSNRSGRRSSRSRSRAARHDARQMHSSSSRAPTSWRSCPRSILAAAGCVILLLEAFAPRPAALVLDASRSPESAARSTRSCGRRTARPSAAGSRPPR